MWRRSSLKIASRPNLHPSSLFLLLRSATSASNSLYKESAIRATSASGWVRFRMWLNLGNIMGYVIGSFLNMLVVATSGTGFVLGSGSSIDYMGLCCTCAGTMMVAAAANSLNQVFEVKNDALMKRTRLRLLPSGRMSVPHAVTFASTVGVAGTALLACEANAPAAGLAASNLIPYSFIYTPLKQIHPVNTWVGAIVGAFPPLLGWVAASGQVSMNATILPAALYFWQLPPFYGACIFMSQRLRRWRGELHLGGSVWSLHSFLLQSVVQQLRSISTVQQRVLGQCSTPVCCILPVFMSGLLFHRVADNDQCLTTENSHMFKELSSSKENTMLQKNSDQCLTVEDSRMFNENLMLQKKATRKSTGNQVRLPVSYASIAPFPFLPAPSYP